MKKDFQFDRKSKYRQIYGISATDIARSLGLSVLTVTKVLSCVKNPQIENDIARLLHVSEKNIAEYFKIKRGELRDLECGHAVTRKKTYRSLVLSAEEDARKISAFLLKNPLKDTDIRRAGLKNALIFSYGSLGLARKAMGLPERSFSKNLRGDVNQNLQLLSYLEKNPHCGLKDIAARWLPSLRGMGGLATAKRKAGIIPPDWVLASQKARELGYSRQELYRVIKKKKVPSLRIGNFLYVPTTLNHWQGKRRA